MKPEFNSIRRRLDELNDRLQRLEPLKSKKRIIILKLNLPKIVVSKKMRIELKPGVA
jgi:hypothetical protein